MTATLLQPHEGVRGVARDAGDPMVTERGSEVVLQLAAELHRAALASTRGRPELWTRMAAPVVGDVVFVLDATVMRNPDARYKAVGYLVERRCEWWTTDEEWARAVADGEVYPDDERLVERDACYVQYGPEPGDVCRWTNCMIYAVPLAER